LNPEISNILYNFLPELILAITIITINILRLFNKPLGRVIHYLFISGITLALFFVLLQPFLQPLSAFGGLLVIDHLAYFGKLVLLAPILFFAVFLIRSPAPSGEIQLILAIALSSFVAVSSSNLLMTFVSLELGAVSFYFLFSDSDKTLFRYYVYGSVLSGMALFGLTMLYGICGSFDYYDISRSLSVNPFNTLTVTLSVILIISGFSFRMFLLLFNFYYPSLSEKIPLWIFGLYSVSIPAIMFTVVLRFFTVAFHDSGIFISESSAYNYVGDVKWDLMFAFLGTLTFLAGNLVILWQYSLRKIISFLIIGQCGFIIMGMASPTSAGTEAMLFNVIVFIVCGSGIFYCLKIIEEDFLLSALDSLKGIGRSNPLLTISLIIFLAAFAGFPLTAGFTGRLLLMPELLRSYNVIPFIVSVLSSISLLFFIFRISYSSFSSQANTGQGKLNFVNKAVLISLAVPVLLGGLFTESVINWIRFCREVFETKIL
jgi:NADH-quinone oxidoreductase subunit N